MQETNYHPSTLWQRRQDFPWRPVLRMLGKRFSEDNLAVTAGSLTFSTLTAIVPLFAIVLSVFTAFPVFNDLKDTLELWMIQNLIPEVISDQVVQGVTTFATHARNLGAVGIVFFVVTAFTLMSGINQHLNAIWRVKTSRPWAQLLLIYWAAITLGPLILGAGVAASSYVVSLSSGWLTGSPVDTPSGIGFLISASELLLMSTGFAALYHYVPNTHVRWTHAYIGGWFTAMGLALAQNAMGWYLSQVPSYSLIYGTFATVPIMLLWIYLSWIIVLLGAIIAAYLPSVIMGVRQHEQGRAWQVQQAFEVLRHMQAAPEKKFSIDSLAVAMRIEAPLIEPVLEDLASVGWVGRLDEEGAPWVLLVHPETTAVSELLAAIAIPADCRMLWQRPLQELTLAEVLANPQDKHE